MTVTTIGVVKEDAAGELRVALVPEVVPRLTKAGVEVLVEAGAGSGGWFGDDAYVAAGASIVDRADLLERADVLLCVRRPADDVLDRLRPGRIVVGLLDPLGDPAGITRMAAAGVTGLALEGLPRTLSRAQTMDALTSQANVAGYKAVLVAANAFGRYFPMLMTAAGTVRPAQVLVLGVGVAGLQAVGTARRLGAMVSAYDVRPEARDEAKSVGASFLELPTVAAGAGEGGYARALTPDELLAQQEALAAAIARHDVVITTALVPGRRPPLLVTEDAVKAMRPGSVVLDMAAGPNGGNVAGSQQDTTQVTDHGVTLIGARDLAATVPVAASTAYSRNIAALVLHLLRDGQPVVDTADDIVAGVLVTRTEGEGAA
jgi:NAD(P) transhydrogenase subunit alpha